MTHILFNRDHQIQFQRRNRDKFESHAFLFEWAKEQIIDRLQDIKKEFSDKVILGNRVQIDGFKNINPASNESEILQLEPKSCDCIISVLDLHTINNLPDYLLQIRHALRDDGLFLGAIFGGETLYELRHSLMTAEIELYGGASPRVFPFADKQQIGSLMQRAGFALPVIDSEIIRTSYQTMFNVMGDIRGMGEQNCLMARHKKFTPSALFFRAAEIYQSQFAEADTRVTASFEIIFMIGWAPHKSQQQPLKPGSATAPLSDIL